MIRARLLVADQVKYANQTYDAAFSASSATMQLSVESVEAFNGSAAENNLGIAHSIGSGNVSNSLSGNNYSIKCKEKFNLVALNMGTADTSGATFTYKYWDGSTFSTLALINTPILTSTGKKAILFSSPSDWALDSGNYYTIRIDGSGTPNFALTDIKVCRMLAYREGVNSKDVLAVNFEDDPILLQTGEAIVGFFSFPDSLNTMKASYRNSP